MNTQSMNGRKVGYGKIELPGDFCFGPDEQSPNYIYIWLPGTPGPDALCIKKGPNPPTPRIWGWDGNLETPTLNPSIHAPGQWHGYLRSGRLVSC